MAFCKFLLNDGTSNILLNDAISELLMNDNTCGGAAAPTGYTDLFGGELIGALFNRGLARCIFLLILVLPL